MNLYSLAARSRYLISDDLGYQSQRYVIINASMITSYCWVFENSSLKFETFKITSEHTSPLLCTSRGVFVHCEMQIFLRGIFRFLIIFDVCKVPKREEKSWIVELLGLDLYRTRNPIYTEMIESYIFEIYARLSVISQILLGNFQCVQLVEF